MGPVANRGVAQPTIYPQEVHYTFIPSALITRSCRKFPSAWLCDAPVSHRRSCVSDLYYNTSVTCSTTKPIQDNAHMVRGMHPLFYFPEDTEILITCPETPPTQTKAALQHATTTNNHDNVNNNNNH